jgi:putative YhdH/YhfP family quinone oxidoreductase
MPDKFRAYRIEESGAGMTALALDELDAGSVVVRVEYSSINYKDALAATGAGKIIRRFPCVGGVDLAGRVHASNDARFSPGDAVLATGYDLGVSHDGGYAEFAHLPGDWLVPLPRGYDTFDAMAIGTAGFTAALAIVRMEANGLAPNNGPVIVTGASGGVGSIAIDILSTLGYAVTALTGKLSEHDYLRELGASDILDRHQVERGSRPLENAKWAGAIDNLGGDWLAWLTRTSMQRGCIASIGLAAGAELHTTVMPFILRGVSLLGIDSSATPMTTREAVWRRLAADMRPRHLKRIAQTIAFDELPAWFPRFLEGGVRGRVVVRIA